MLETRSPPSEKQAVKRDYLSFSAISLYAACPLRYAFKYLAGLPEEVVSSSLVFGAGIHAALQCHFERQLAGDTPPSHDILLEVFWQAWHERDHQTVRFGKGEDINEIGRLADRMLLAFRSSQLASPQGRVIAVEEELRGQILPGLPDLLARIDLMIESDDAVTVQDFKTARNGWSCDQADDNAGQLLLYHELAKTLAGGKELRLEFAVLTKAKVPDIAIHSVTVNPHRIERTKAIVEKVWRAIQHGHFYPSPSPLNCPSCPYQHQCKAWKG